MHATMGDGKWHPILSKERKLVHDSCWLPTNKMANLRYTSRGKGNVVFT